MNETKDHEPTDYHGWLTLEEINQTLGGMSAIFEGNEGLKNLKLLRREVAYLVRSGAVPKPHRIPRPDGRPGTIGVYPPEALDAIRELLAEKEKRGVTRQSLAKRAGEVKGGQRLVSVSFWLPEELVKLVERHVQAGFPLSRQLLIGSRLFHDTDEEVRFTLIKDWLADQGVSARRRALDDRWQYASCLVLSGHLLDRLDQLTSKVKVSRERLLTEVRFDFVVQEGRVILKTAHVKDAAGKWQAVEVQDG